MSLWDGVRQQLEDALERADWVRQGLVCCLLLFKLKALVDEQGGLTTVMDKLAAATKTGQVILCSVHLLHLGGFVCCTLDLLELRRVVVIAEVLIVAVDA